MSAQSLRVTGIAALEGVPIPAAVTLACSGADAMALCLGAVYANPVTWRSSITAAAGGIALIAFLPLLGWANWLIIPLAIIGAVVGMASRSTAGRNLNLFVIVVGVIRLMLGGGIL